VIAWAPFTTLAGKSTITPTEDKTLQKALDESFQTHDYHVLDTFTAGNTAAKLFKIEVKGAPYVARFLDPNEPQESHQREIRWLKYASDKGVGPTVYFADRHI